MSPAQQAASLSLRSQRPCQFFRVLLALTAPWLAIAVEVPVGGLSLWCRNTSPDGAGFRHAVSVPC